jgi:uncharacterized MAPEG superfamily protein
VAVLVAAGGSVAPAADPREIGSTERSSDARAVRGQRNTFRGRVPFMARSVQARLDAVRAEAERAAADPEDLAEARRVRAEMDALAAPWPER